MAFSRAPVMAHGSPTPLLLLQLTGRSPVLAQIQVGQFSSLEGRVSGEASHLVTGLLQVKLQVMLLSIVRKPS